MAAAAGAGGHAQAPDLPQGFTAAVEVAAAYDAVMNAEFDRIAEIEAETCGPAPHVACLVIRAQSTWWEIELDPASRALDARFTTSVEHAIGDADDWTRKTPGRAEAWFYLGAALGARAQWKVLRGERLSAARDGSRIKSALERALRLDPDMHDAEFGIGLYRYYADVAPAVLRWLRWLFLLPGGDREEGLEQLRRASRLGQLVSGEADYQIHLIDLWYEKRYEEALDLVLSLQQRYPRNPRFRQIEAEIRDVYFSDARGSLEASRSLLELAREGEVNRPHIAAVHARLNIAAQLDRLGHHDRAHEVLDALIAERPAAPIDAMARAQRLRRAIDRR
jgi:tetratricopeptide (TPR) repeat protein